MSPAPRKPAAPKTPAKPRAARAKPAPKPEPAVAPAGPRSPALAAGTGQLMPGGSSSSPLPVMTPQRPPAPATEVVAGLPGPTPGAAGPRGAALDEPWPAAVQIERVSAAPLETGLSDYVFWVEYMADHEPTPAPPGLRRGRIWA